VADGDRRSWPATPSRVALPLYSPAAGSPPPITQGAGARPGPPRAARASRAGQCPQPGPGTGVTRNVPPALVRAVPVNLLGTPVTAWVALNAAEHRRREAIGLGAVTDPALLDQLLNLPLGIPVDDPVAWAETAAQPDGVIRRRPDGRTVTRQLDSPLYIEAVVVAAAPGGDLRAVQDASLFASYCHRWVAAARPAVAEAAVLEAKLCGVGLLGRSGEVLLRAGAPVDPITDGWTWTMREKAYRRMLRLRPG